MERQPVERLISAATRRPAATILLALLVTLAGLLVAAARFDMTTDTAQLISDKVSWRQQEIRTENAFPQLRDAMLVVIDGRTPELAEDAAVRLAAKLGEDKAHFRRVTRPDGGDFFAREGLLFGSTDEVREATRTMITAQPMLGPLAADPSLRGIAEALTTAMQGVEAGATRLDALDRPMRAMADASETALAGKTPFFSWQKLFAAQDDRLAPPTRRLVLVQPVLDHSSIKPGEAAQDAVNAAATALGLDAAHGVNVRMTGEVALADEEFSTLEENIGLVALVMLAAMLLTLWLGTRSVKLVTAIFLTILAGLIITTALGLLAVGRFNLISVAFIPLFVGLGVDFGIQISVRFNAERAAGADAREALARAGAALGPSLMLAAGAIVLGFTAFLPTAYKGIAELGVIAAIGMGVALLLSVTLLPALILALGAPAPQREVGFRELAPVDRWLHRRRNWVLGAFAVSMLASIVSLYWVRFDFNPMHLRNAEAPAMRTLTDLTRDPDRSPNGIDVLAVNRAEAQALVKRLSALPEVRQTIWLDSFIPDDQAQKLALIQDASLLLDLTLNPFDITPPPSDAERVAALNKAADALDKAADASHGADATDARRLAGDFRRIAAAPPAVRDTLEQALVKPLNVTLDSFRYALQAEEITPDTLPDDIARDWLAPDGQMRIQLMPAGDPDDNAVLRRFRDAVAQVTPAISGLPVATQAAAGTVAWAFVQAGIIAFALVSLLLLAVLRDLREVAFTLAPVILSIFLTLGTCVAIGQPINFANIIAFPLLFGVGVAFHIYFVMAWRGGASDLLQSSLARAVLFSAFATGTAFGALWLSTHPGTASMGKILMLSLAWTLVCALIFEPALLGPPRGAKPARA